MAYAASGWQHPSGGQRQRRRREAAYKDSVAAVLSYINDEDADLYNLLGEASRPDALGSSYRLAFLAARSVEELAAATGERPSEILDRLIRQTHRQCRHLDSWAFPLGGSFGRIGSVIYYAHDMAAWSRSKTHEHHGSSFTSPREAMDDAIKRIVVADLRQRGFRGSLPHLRRRDSDRISLVSFQHFSGGGGFVVEVAVCPPGGYTTSWGDEIAPSKVRAVDIKNPRPRLGNPNFPSPGDHWFSYGPRSYEPGGQTIQPSEHYDEVARTVVALLDSQAEPFWHGFPA